MPGTEEPSAPRDTWAALCQNFHTVRERAYKHHLEEHWRGLARQGPLTGDLLREWLELLAELEHLDTGPARWNVRHGGQDDNCDDWDDWDEQPERFACPLNACTRVSGKLITQPRCWLGDKTMIPLRAPNHDH